MAPLGEYQGKFSFTLFLIGFLRCCIVCALVIYVTAGRAIFAKRKQLRSFTSDPIPLRTTITHTLTHQQDDATALDANTAIWAYTRSAMLFFFSLLITWVSRDMSLSSRSLGSTGRAQKVRSQRQ